MYRLVGARNLRVVRCNHLAALVSKVDLSGAGSPDDRRTHRKSWTPLPPNACLATALWDGPGQ
jgi:hypothetical protein